MSDLTASMTVHAGPARVFAVMTDLANAAKIIPEIVRTELLTPGAFAAGTRWRETRRMMGKEATVELTVTECRADAGYTVTCEAMGTKFTTRFDFRPSTSGCAIDVNVDMESKGLMAKMAAAAMKGPMKTTVMRDLERIKAAAEGAGSTRGSG